MIVLISWLLGINGYWISPHQLGVAKDPGWPTWQKSICTSIYTLFVVPLDGISRWNGLVDITCWAIWASFIKWAWWKFRLGSINIFHPVDSFLLLTSCGEFRWLWESNWLIQKRRIGKHQKYRISWGPDFRVIVSWHSFCWGGQSFWAKPRSTRDLLLGSKVFMHPNSFPTRQNVLLNTKQMSISLHYGKSILKVISARGF